MYIEDFFPIIIAIFVFLFCTFIVKNIDNDTIEKIDNLVNKNNLEVYENCWELQGKYYCKKENE